METLNTTSDNNSYNINITQTKLSSSSLQQTVWLKGDEDFFEDFNWNADQVMNYLGIKRSRLNQISGKELRVGKKNRSIYKACIPTK